MTKDLGDPLHAGTIIVTETSDGSGSAGDFVKENGSGKVTPTAGTGEDVYGVISSAQDMSNVSDGDEISVVIFGPVVGNAGGSVTKGDIGETSGTNGQLAQNSNNKEVTGGSFTGTFAPGNPYALSDSGGTYDGASLGANEAAFFMR